MFVKFSEKAQKALVMAESSAYHFRQSEVTSQHLLLALLKMPELSFCKALKQYMINDKKMAAILEVQACEDIPSYLEYSDELRQIIEYAMVLAVSKKVSADLLGYVMIDSPTLGRKTLQDFGVDLELLKHQLTEKKEQALVQFNELIDLNEKVRKKKIQVIGRDAELALLMEMLCRKEKNNAIIVGDAGVGKTALVEKLAATLNELPATHPLYKKKVYELDLAGVLAGTKYRGDFEEKLKKIIYALKDDKYAIVFIDEIHNLVDAGKAEGAIDASNILKPYLARGEISCIGATTYQEYKKHFESDPALNRRFSKIDLKEEKEDAILRILKGLKKGYTQFHQVNISDEVLEYIIEMTSNYMRDRQQPDKSLDVLDLCCVKARMESKPSVSKEIVESVVEELCGFSFKTPYAFDESLEELIPFYDGLRNGKHSFLFVGNVNSKQLRKATEHLNKHFILYSMTEYKEHYGLYRLLGESKTNLSVIEEVKRYPESIIVLDDFEYAPLSIHKFFMKIIQEKEYNSVDFSRVIFILIQRETSKGVSGFMKKEKTDCISNCIDQVIHFKSN